MKNDLNSTSTKSGAPTTAEYILSEN